MINADKTHRLNAFGDNAKGKTKLKAGCLFGTILVSNSSFNNCVKSNPSMQAWADFETSTLRGYASYVCFRVKRYKDARPG